MWFDLHFVMTSDVFMCIDHFLRIVCRNVHSNPLPILVDFLLLLNYRSYLYISGYQYLSDVLFFEKYFLPFHILSFHSVNNALCFREVFNLKQSAGLFFLLPKFLVLYPSQESINNQYVLKLLLLFSSIGFIVLALIFYVLIHFKLIFVCVVLRPSLFSRFYRFAVSSSLWFLQIQILILNQISYADLPYVTLYPVFITLVLQSTLESVRV